MPRRAGLLSFGVRRFIASFVLGERELPKAGNKSGDESPHSKAETQKNDGQKNQETLI
jgi:hypothetical protein